MERRLERFDLDQKLQILLLRIFCELINKNPIELLTLEAMVQASNLHYPLKRFN